MLLEFLNGEPIKVDGSPILKDLRINFPKGRNALRAKATYIEGKKDIPLDINIYGYSNVKIDGITSLAINVDGKELNHDVPFVVRLSYNIMKHNLFISGQIKGKSINKTVDDVPSLISEVMKYI